MDDAIKDDAMKDEGGVLKSFSGGSVIMLMYHKAARSRTPPHYLVLKVACRSTSLRDIEEHGRCARTWDHGSRCSVRRPGSGFCLVRSTNVMTGTVYARSMEQRGLRSPQER